jgi:alkanesulfonate monooxygenase SsuD/methylene tetrahydromethanopterin reductase-like flavin-dependent oxidoreductase (luciferase family)
MDFGLFIPQGWRLDLVGIAPERQWHVMRELASYADNGAWDSLWVYDHFHTVPVPSAEATHEAWPPTRRPRRGSSSARCAPR